MEHLNTERPVVYRDKWMSNYGSRRICEDTMLLVNAGADWCFLTEEEYRRLGSVSLPLGLYEKLERNRLIITGKNALSVIETYQKWNRKKYDWPDLHIIEITKACNLQCIYCHMSSSPSTEGRKDSSMTTETMRRTIDTVMTSPSENIHVEFQGGEVLLNFQAVELGVEYGKAKYEERGKKGELDFSIVSNLTLLTSEHCKFLKKHDVSVCTTIDGPQFIHDFQRKSVLGKGSFADVDNGIKTLRANGIRSFGVLSVITAKSVPYMAELVNMFLDIGLTDISFIFVNSLGRARTNWDEVGLDWEEEAAGYRKLLEVVMNYWKNGIYIGERKLLVSLEKLFSPSDTCFTDFRNPCGMVRGQIAYDYKGDIYTCDEGRSFPEFKISPAEIMDLKCVVDSDAADVLISKSLPNYEECGVCAYRSLCGLCPVQRLATEVVTEHSAENKSDNACMMAQLIFDYIFGSLAVNPGLLKSYYLYSIKDGISSDTKG